MERKVFTHLVSSNATALHNALSKGGFRRSQNIAYRPSCQDCNACVSVRVPVSQFALSRNQKRIMRKNKDLVRTVLPASATSEQYSLFRSYIDHRHLDGGMVDMTVLDYAAMVEESLVNTQIIEYRLHPEGSSGLFDNSKGELLACVLIDQLDDGLSMIYSFFDPEQHNRSLGTFMILDQIEHARKQGKEHVYLGYWVDGSDKMNYKSQFLPQERLQDDRWQRFVSK